MAFSFFNKTGDKEQKKSLTTLSSSRSSTLQTRNTTFQNRTNVQSASAFKSTSEPPANKDLAAITAAKIAAIKEALAANKSITASQGSNYNKPNQAQTNSVNTTAPATKTTASLSRPTAYIPQGFPTANTSTQQNKALSVSERMAQARKTLAALTGSNNRDPDAPPTKRVAPRVIAKVTDMQFRRFAAFIEEKCGIVLAEGKQYLVNSRLSNLVVRFNCADIDDLINQAMEDRPNNRIQEAVIDAMTTNETLWFRDTYPYLALQNIILPELAMKARYPIRIWSAACSSGQEPYSIAMTVMEQLVRMIHVDPTKTQIIGTDLSPQMLEQCRLAQYDVHALSRGLSLERRGKFFKPTRNPNMMQVDDRLKQMVEFRPLNLLGSFALMGRFDVIFCRNVLIYFNNEIKAEILRKLTMCLNPGGYLILGSSESLTGVSDKFEMVRCNPGIIYRIKSSRFG